ncbi:MAG: HAD family hydrolase [Oscillospiraceae bacterium]|nr:HAD family hydrolase [Oscillospiraceae bacterium]
MKAKAIIFDLDGTLLESMHIWQEPVDRKRVAMRYKTEVVLKPGVLEFLQSLNQYQIPMILATATDREMMEPALHRNEIYDFFDTILTCKEVGESKLTPLIYHAALERLSSAGIKQQDVLIFEDAHYAIRTTTTANFRTVAIADEWVHLYGEQIPHKEIISLCEMYVEDYRKLSVTASGDGSVVLNKS